MPIELNGSYRGDRIVEAFIKASDFAIDAKHRWRAHEFVDEITFDNNTKKQIIISMGACANPHKQRKRWKVIGEKIWVPEKNLRLVLKPLVLADIYSQVKVFAKWIVEKGKDESKFLSDDIISPVFDPSIKKDFSTIISNMKFLLKNS